jgi:SAM-dependent methyltransferase
MRAEFARNVPSAIALDGTAEALPLPDGSVDVVIAAQAFHWFDGERALEEFARVLVPGGRVVLVWNQPDERVPWVAAARSIVEPERKGAPTYRSGEWRRAFDETRAFDPLVTEQFPLIDRRPDEASFRDRYASISFVAALTEAERAPLLNRIVEIRKARGDGSFDIPYVSNSYWTRRH